MASDRSLDPRLVIARRDLSSLSREKTIVLALLIQLFVAAFSSFLVVGLTSLYDPGSVEAGQVEIGVTGDAREDLEGAVRERDGSSAVPFEDPAVAQRSFQGGQVDALLSASYVDASDGGGRVIHVTATAPEGSIRTTLIVVEIRRALTALERQERVERVEFLDERPLTIPAGADASPYFGFTYTILLPLLLFLPAFISGSVAVDTVTEELERGTMELLRVAPVSLTDVVDGKALAMVALAPAQAALWLLLLSLNGIGVAHPVALLVLTTALAALVVTFGLVLGLAFGRRRPAQLLYSVLTLVIFGGTVLLPEHPATTIAKLAVDSATPSTYAHVVGFALAAVAVYLAARQYVRGIDAESL